MTANNLFDQAEKMAENKEIRLRVKVARLPIQYVMIATDRVLGFDKKEILDSFINVARKIGLTHISERKTLEDWIKSLS